MTQPYIRDESDPHGLHFHQQATVHPEAISEYPGLCSKGPCVRKDGHLGACQPPPASDPVCPWCHDRDDGSAQFKVGIARCGKCNRCTYRRFKGMKE